MKRTFKDNVVVAALLVVGLLTSTVLAGWIFEIKIFKTLLPGRPDMKANAAICFILMAASLWLTHPSNPSPSRKKLGIAFSGFVLIFSVAVLIEYFFNVTLFIDEFLFKDAAGAFGHSPPGRFSSLTATCFVAISSAVLLDSAFRNPWRRTSQWIYIMTFLEAFQSFVGNVLGHPEIFGMDVFMPMAVQTALIFLLLCVIFFLSRSDYGYLERFSANNPSAVIARRTLVAVVFIPAAIRIVSFLSTRAGWITSDFSNFLHTMGSMTFMSILAITTAGALFKVEKEREKLRESEKRNADQLKLVTDALPSLIAYVGRDSRLLIVNQAFENWFGQPKSTFVGQYLQEIYSKDSTLDLQTYLNRALHGEYVHFKNEVVLHDGKAITVDTMFIPDRNESGAARGFVVVSHDISEAIQAQNELQKAKERAEEASRTKSQFLANMSHEIRTPLGVILGFSDLAIESLDQPQETKKFLESIRRNANELLKLLGEILDLSKVEAKKLEIEKIRFSIRPLVEEVVLMLEPKAQEKGILLQVHIEPTLPTHIDSDPTRIRQILINLLGNAIKFTQTGWVKLHVSAKAPAEHQSSLLLQFEVSDSGLGISAEQRSRLFQAFSQADSSMTRKFGGTGLGLMISKQLAQLLGGDLQLKQSELGQGSTFVATVQGGLAPGEVSTGLQGSPRAVSENRKTVDLKGLRILLVEDATENQLLFNLYLRSTNSFVDVAHNGSEALSKVSQHEYDVILMDIQMPVMDGYQATEILRQQGFTKPIIALTAHAVREEKEKALNAGFSGYLTKPLSRSLLFNVLSDIQIQQSSDQDALS